MWIIGRSKLQDIGYSCYQTIQSQKLNSFIYKSFLQNSHCAEYIFVLHRKNRLMLETSGIFITYVVAPNQHEPLLPITPWASLYNCSGREGVSSICLQWSMSSTAVMSLWCKSAASEQSVLYMNDLEILEMFYWWKGKYKHWDIYVLYWLMPLC